MNDFTRLLRVLGTSYSSIDLRFLSVNMNDKLFCSHGAIRFTHMTTDEVKTRHKILEERLGSREIAAAKILLDVQGFDKWDMLKRQFEAGRIQIDGEPVSLFSPILFPRIHSFSSEKLIMEESKEWNVIQFFYDFTADKTVQASNILRQIDFEKSGYRYGEEFTRAWLKMDLAHQVPRFIFGLPIYVNISGAEPSIENKLKVYVRCHRNLLPLTLQSSTYKRNIEWPFEKNKASLEIGKASIKGDFAYLETTIDFTYGVDHAVYLALVHKDLGKLVNYGRASIEYIESRKKRFEAPPLGILSRFAGDFENLLLKPGGLKNPDLVFERTIHWLFTIAEFEAYWLKGVDQLKIGDGFSPGGADLLVCDSESKLYFLVNCTMNPPRSDKVNKIKNVSNILSNEFNVIVRPLEVVALDASVSKRDFGRIIKIFDYHDLYTLIQTLKEKGRKELRAKILDILKV